MPIKKPEPKKSKSPIKTCDFCGEPITPDYGTAVCVKCGEAKCVQFCIPGGNRTKCVECEEAE